MRQRLGKRVVDAAVAPLRGTRYLWDSEVPGFALRVYRGADGVLRRIYCVRWTSKGRDCWITIGHHGSPGRPDVRGNPRNRHGFGSSVPPARRDEVDTATLIAR